MKNYLKTAIAIAFVTVFASCNKDSGCINASGDYVTRNYNTSDFNALSIEGNAEVFITKDSVSSVRIEGQENILNNLKVNVNGSTLTIEEDNCTSNPKMLKVYLSTASLVSLNSSGVIDIESNDTFVESSFSTILSGSGVMDINIDVQDFQSSISGTGTVIARGKATNQFFASSGDANFECFDLIGEDVYIDVSGTANAEVHATKTLNIEVSGSATIYYKGNPSITQNISGTATIIDAN